MYDKIINPLTNKKVSIYGKLGKKILKKYLNASINNNKYIQRGSSHSEEFDMEMEDEEIDRLRLEREFKRLYHNFLEPVLDDRQKFSFDKFIAWLRNPLTWTSDLRTGTFDHQTMMQVKCIWIYLICFVKYGQKKEYFINVDTKQEEINNLWNNLKGFFSIVGISEQDNHGLANAFHQLMDAKDFEQIFMGLESIPTKILYIALKSFKDRVEEHIIIVSFMITKIIIP